MISKSDGYGNGSGYGGGYGSGYGNGYGYGNGSGYGNGYGYGYGNGGYGNGGYGDGYGNGDGVHVMATSGDDITEYVQHKDLSTTNPTGLTQYQPRSNTMNAIDFCLDLNAANTTTKTTIVVVESGWVFVARNDGSAAACVRAWGTTKGLGELAMNGPTPSTTLDPCGILRVARNKVLFVLACDDAAWGKVNF